jgi:glycosyltransferase involved in cell wall biosynthesis
MKITQTSKAYYPFLGGIETIVQQLAEGFALRQNLESRVVVCNDSRATHHKTYNRVSITYAGTLARIASLPISSSYPFHLLRETGDILHMHEPFLIAPLVCLTFLRQIKKHFKQLVLWWHSDVIRQRSLAPLYTPLFHAILRELDAIIVATPNHITSSTFLPHFIHKCHIIHYGIEPTRFSYTEDMHQHVSEIQLQYNRPIILFVGRLIYYKGVEYLVQAMQDIPEAHLIVVGDGPLKLELQQLSANGHNNVTFLPPLEEKKLVALYQACDIFVLPSVENSEGFGIVQLEAMACGKPVITSDLPTGVTYVNQDGKTGLVVPKRNAHALANAIKVLLANPDLRQKLGEQARYRVEREFTVSGMVDKTIDLYTNLLR